MLKRIIGVLLCLCIFSQLTGAIAVDLTYPNAAISSTLNKNTELMESVFSDNSLNSMNTAKTGNTSLELSINPKDSSASILLTLNNIVYKTELKGTIEEVPANSLIGYVGVFEGFIDNGDIIFSQSGKSQLPIIANVTFTDSEMFAALTIGYADEINTPTIIFYGDFTKDIATISTTYAENAMRAHVEENALRYDQAPGIAAVAGETVLMGTASATLSSYEAGRLSVFHAQELLNQGVMSTYVKVNTKSSNVLSYVKNVLGYGGRALVAFPDAFNISMCGNDNNLHAIANSYLPQNNVTKTTLDIPVYLGLSTPI